LLLSPERANVRFAPKADIRLQPMSGFRRWGAGAVFCPVTHLLGLHGRVHIIGIALFLIRITAGIRKPGSGGGAPRRSCRSA